MTSDLGIDRLLQVKVPVTDVRTAAQWYARLLDMRLVMEFAEEDELRGVVLEEPQTRVRIALRDRAHASSRPVLSGFDLLNLEMISLEASRAVVELDVVARFQASITYNRQGTGTYDNEDGVMLFQDEVEESVSGDHDTRLAVEVTFKDIDPASFKVVKVSFEGEDTIKVYADEDW